MIILLGSMLLGGAQLNQSGFWYDETVSIGFITDSATWYQNSPEQMPVYYLVLRGWTEIAGLSEVAGRALSLFFGLLTLAVTFRLVRRYGNGSTALVALILLGSSAFFVRYYREMRPYALLALTCTLSMYCFLEWRHTHRRRDAAAYLIFSIAAIYTHYFAGLIIAVQGVYFLLTDFPLVWRPRLHVVLKRGQLWTVALFGVIAASVIPYLAFDLTGLKYVTSGRYGILFALTPAQALQSSVSALTNDSLAVFAILLILALVSRRAGFKLMFLWAFLPLTLVLFVHTFIYRMFANPRYILFIWPAFATAAALGIMVLPRPARQITLGVLICIGAAQVYNNLPGTIPGTLNNPPWREMFSTIGVATNANGIVFVNMINPVGLPNYRQPMLYYFNRSLPPTTPKPVELALPPAPNPAQLTALAQKTSEVWFIATDGQSDSRGDAAQNVLISQHFAQCDSWAYPAEQSNLARWDKIDGAAYQFSNGLRVLRAPLYPLKDTYAPGESFDLALGLYTTAALPIDYSMGVYLVDPAGHVAAQSDYGLAHSQSATWLPGDRFCDVRHLKLPAAAGTYTVRIVIYDSASGVRLSAPPDTLPDNFITFGNIIDKKR